MSSTLSNVRVNLGFNGNIVSGELVGTVGHNPTEWNPDIGTGSGQVNIQYGKDHTISAGSPLDIDLTNTVDSAGNAISFGNLLWWCVENTSSGTNSLQIGGGSNPVWATADPFLIRGGGHREGLDTAGFAISGSNKNFRVTCSGGTMTARISMLGR